MNLFMRLRISSSHVKAGLCLSSVKFFSSSVLLYFSKKNVITGYDYDEEYSIYCGFGWAPCFCYNNTDIGDLSAKQQGGVCDYMTRSKS